MNTINNSTLANLMNNDEQMDTLHHSPAPHGKSTVASFPPPQIFSAATTMPPLAPNWSSFTHHHDFPSSTSISLTSPALLLQNREEEPKLLESEKQSSMAAMREMIFRVAAMQPVVHVDTESVKVAAPKRRNVKISKDPQSMAARLRRGRISERIRILQRMVPGGTKMDTASMLDEAVHYLKFLKKQVQSLQRVGFPSYLPPPSKGYEAQSTMDYFRNAEHV